MRALTARSSRRAAPARRPAASSARPAWLVPGAIFILAFVLRLVYVIQQSRANPQFFAPLMDPEYHDQWAWALARGTWQPDGPFFRAPLYPLFLAAIYFVFGHDYLAARVIQALIGSLSCVFVYLIGTRLFSRPAGLLAGLGAALSWILIFFDNELLIEGLFIGLVLASFYALLRALGGPLFDGPQEKRPQIWAAMSGALFGLAGIARPNGLILLPAVAWAFVRAGRRGLSRTAPLLFAILAVIPIVAVTLYNATAGNDFVFIASQGGVNFYIGNNPESDGRTAVVPGTRADWWGGRYDTIRIAEEAEGRDLKESEISSYWFRRGLRYVVSQPFDWLGLTLRKLGLFWSAPEIGNNESVYHLRDYASLMKSPLLGFGLIAPLAAAGVFLAVRRRSPTNAGAPDLRRRAALPLAFIGLYMVGVVAFFVCARFRIPVIPFLLLFAGLAIQETLALWKSGDRRTLVVAAAILIIAAIAVNAPARFHRENVALARFHDGLAWSKLGDSRKAEAAWRDAIRIDPALTVARTNLANLLARQSGGDAVAEYERVIAENPGSVKAYANLATYHLEHGDAAAAESVVAKGLAIDSQASAALRVLGLIRERKGDFAGAREAYLQALRFPEEPHRVENNLGVLAMKTGDVVEGEARFRRALEFDPGYAMAWGNLGKLLAGAQRFDEARSALAKAAELDPHRPERWTDLAQVLGAMGRTKEAQEAQQRAAMLSRREPER